MSSIRERKNVLGQYAPEIQKKSLNDFIRPEFYDKINTCPVYQRHIRWTPNAMNDFIYTVMNNGLVPGFILYQLMNEERIEKNAGKVFEMVDGQHRLYALKAFVDATERKVQHVKNSFVVHWKYDYKNENGVVEYSRVFYKETRDVREYCRKNKFIPHYLTDEEREYFDNFGVNLTLIRSALQVEQRREIFMTLQKGIPVRNSDLLKNKTDCKLVAFIRDNGYEEMMTNIVFERCYKKAPKYWIHWVCRCYFMYMQLIENNKGNENYENKINKISKEFLKEDNLIELLIKTNDDKLNTMDETDLDRFHDVFMSFIAFLQQFEENKNSKKNEETDEKEYYCLNPTQLFALFYVLCDETKDKNIILTHIEHLSCDGQIKSKKTLWNSKDLTVDCDKYFKKCVFQMNHFTEIAGPIQNIDIENIPKNKLLKKRVWNKCVDNHCQICNDTITEKDFKVGHIVPISLGGITILENLIPVCVECYRGINNKNANEYKINMYPNEINENIS